MRTDLRCLVECPGTLNRAAWHSSVSMLQPVLVAEISWGPWPVPLLQSPYAGGLDPCSLGNYLETSEQCHGILVSLEIASPCLPWSLRILAFQTAAPRWQTWVACSTSFSQTPRRGMQARRRTRHYRRNPHQTPDGCHLRDAHPPHECLASLCTKIHQIACYVCALVHTCGHSSEPPCIARCIGCPRHGYVYTPHSIILIIRVLQLLLSQCQQVICTRVGPPAASQVVVHQLSARLQPAHQLGQGKSTTHSDVSPRRLHQIEVVWVVLIAIIWHDSQQFVAQPSQRPQRLRAAHTEEI